MWLGTRPDVALSPASRALFDHGTPFAVGALLVTGAVLLWRRVEPLPASVLMWLTVYAFGINFGITYLIWGMPFFLLAGYLRAVLLIQAALVIPLALLYIRIGRDLPLHWVYTPILLALWIGLVAWFVVAIRPRGSPGRGLRSRSCCPRALIESSPSPTTLASSTSEVGRRR